MNEYNSIINVIKNISTSRKNNHFPYDEARKLYIKSLLLLESNDLILYDQYFSNEFKIGFFVPIMLPLFYGLIKTLKHIFKKDSNN